MTMQILRFPLAAPARSLTVALLAAASLAATGAADEKPGAATPTTRQPKRARKAAP